MKVSRRKRLQHETGRLANELHMIASALQAVRDSSRPTEELLATVVLAFKGLNKACNTATSAITTIFEA